MKYALSLFTFLIITISAPNAFARSINSFNDSDAILTLAQFLTDAGEDMPVSNRINDKKINLETTTKCTDVTSTIVMREVENVIKGLMSYYPDEELPYDQALLDFEDYIGKDSYKKCVFEKKTAQATVKTIYFVDAADTIHLRVDKVTLKAE